MFRYSLLSILISFLCIYAWKDWYKSLCGLIILLAVLERPDMPKQLFGVPGLNPWNMLLLFILLAWFFDKVKNSSEIKLPNHIKALFGLFLIVILTGYFREIARIDTINEFSIYFSGFNQSKSGLFIDDVINTVKYMIPMILFFDGAKDKNRVKLGIIAVVILHVILAVQIIKLMPLSFIMDASTLEARAARVLGRDIGYFRTDLAMMLSGAIWATFFLRNIVSKTQAFFLLISFVVLFLSLALTGGRTGYGSFFMIALILGVVKWRKLLLIIPVLVLISLILLPSVGERITQGFDEDDESHFAKEGVRDAIEDKFGPSEIDLYTITSGRAFAWIYVLEKAEESILFGYGRRGMQSSGLSLELAEGFNEGFPHPHNAYLEILLDNGIIGAFPILLLFFLITVYFIRLLLSEDKYISSVGAICLSVLLGFILASIGAQSFYPKESSVSMWAIIGIGLRVYVTRNLPEKT